MSKTYVLKANTNRSKTHDAYTPIVFPSRGLVDKWRDLDPEHDIVFDTGQELADHLSPPELMGVHQTLIAMGYMKREVFETHLERAKAIYSWAAKQSMPYQAGMIKVQEYDIDNPANVKGVAAEERRPRDKTISAERRPKHFKLEDPITVIGDNKLKPGSNRHRNRQVVMQASTVGEALKALRTLSPPGITGDIDLAVKDGVIKVGG